MSKIKKLFWELKMRFKYNQAWKARMSEPLEIFLVSEQDQK